MLRSKCFQAVQDGRRMARVLHRCRQGERQRAPGRPASRQRTSWHAPRDCNCQPRLTRAQRKGAPLGRRFAGGHSSPRRVGMNIMPASAVPLCCSVIALLRWCGRCGGLTPKFVRYERPVPPRQ